jgi:zinc finger protein CreA/MIG
MDELYSLEREEALRRAEYEARHAEALRRVSQRENNQSVRVSKSAKTSPIVLPLQSNLSNSERERQGGGGEDLKPVEKTRRRMSGPAWQMTPLSHEPSLGHPHTSGHVIESSGSTGLHTHSGRPHVHWGHPYQTPLYPPSHQYRHLTQHDDTPSPLSSDSDSLPPHNSTHSPTHSFSTQSHPMRTFGPSDTGARPSEFAFTPSTSPFLGPLRTLNLHSANTSRAPSPILLPLPSMGSGLVADGSISPIGESHSYGPRSGKSSLVGSPTSGSVLSRSTTRRRPSVGDDKPHHLPPLSHTQSQLSHLTERGPPSSLHTPQLSSGPSSDGSSPRSSSYPLGTSALSGSAPFNFDPASDTPSAANSRPSSPTHWQPSSYPSHHGRDHSCGGASSNHPHHHLAHSVRKAFGMTPIQPPPRNISWPSSLSAQVQSSSSYPSIFSTSMPASRSGSPPITLPPLKSASSLSHRPSRYSRGEDSIYYDDDGDIVGAKRIHPSEKLPGFSEFEAASCAPNR